MCGIMGYYSFGNILPDKEEMAAMFSLLETRGRDASGWAFVGDDQLFVHKAPIKSSLMVQTKEWKKLNLKKLMIFHTRAATQGNNKNNANNHPIYNKLGLCVIHNGIINNDKDIFGKNPKRDGEVDSEAILAVLSSNGKGDKIKRVFDRLDGSFAFAAINKNEPEKLILVKKDNPVDLYYDAKDDILYFGSERRIMQEALGLKTDSFRGFNIGEGSFHFYEMKNNHALIINAEGVESYERYSPRKFSYRNYDFLYPSHKDEMIVECPHCLSSTRYNMCKLINRCETCGMEINEEDMFYV
jgi:asparagine synthetase B (glutamine-hydrolysing)